jgi:hypothetical protein
MWYPTNPKLTYFIPNKKKIFFSLEELRAMARRVREKNHCYFINMGDTQPSQTK